MTTSKRYMTKAEALMCFKQLWNLNPVWEKKDKIAKRESWNNFTDSLCKSDNISLKQYENWDQPF
jgi:hypothetical protein